VGRRGHGLEPHHGQEVRDLYSTHELAAILLFFSVQSCAVAILAVGVSRCQRALLSVAIYGFFRVI
jgi:hypothetical protein